MDQYSYIKTSSLDQHLVRPLSVKDKVPFKFLFESYSSIISCLCVFASYYCIVSLSVITDAMS